ncbi:hypothetical protein V3C99_018727 [Haemonchus contortus]
MYPNQSYTGYHTNTMGVWNQAAVPQNSQGIGYAVPYAHPEVTTYVEKATFPNPYGTLYAAESDYYRHSYANPTSQQPGQWTQSGFHQYMLAPQYRRSVTDCYDRHRPNMPNTARPPPSMKTDNSDNTFHASLSMLENPTQNSAAAYTASWVSSTSSIPPELRDEPEVPSFNGSAHSGGRDDLAAGASAVFTPPVSTFADQFSNISITEKDGESLTTQWENPTILAAQQWPGLGQDGGGGGASVGQERRRRADERQLHARESSKELTWEERIRKGAVQKERVEQRGLERPERTERDGRENNSGNVRHKGQRGGRYGVPSRSDRLGRETILSPILGDRDDYPCRNGQTIRSTRGNRTVERPIHHDTGARIVPMRAPQYYSHGVPLLMARGAYYRAGPPPVVCIPQQDQRFRNTWLDASLGINYPSVQMVDYSFTPCCGGYRTRPISGVRSGCRYASKNLCKENVKSQCNEQTSIETDRSRRAQNAVENNDLSKADEEEDWDAEIKEQKRSRWPRNRCWPYDREEPESNNPTIEENHTADEKHHCEISDTSFNGKTDACVTTASE